MNQRKRQQAFRSLAITAAVVLAFAYDWITCEASAQDQRKKDVVSEVKASGPAAETSHMALDALNTIQASPPKGVNLSTPECYAAGCIVLARVARGQVSPQLLEAMKSRWDGSVSISAPTLEQNGDSSRTVVLHTK